MISYLQVVAPFPQMRPVTKMLLPVCEPACSVWNAANIMKMTKHFNLWTHTIF